VSSFETGNVTSMEEMFSDLFSIKTLDLRNFDTRNVTNMNSMFAGSGMSTIYSGDHWKLENSESMFWACENLMGGQGTTFNWNHTDGEYARPDGGPSAPGYFTDREPYAVYNNGILTFYYDRNKETRQGEKYRINGGDREIKVVSIENAENPWDTQFFIRLPEGKELSAGDNIRFSMDVKASQDAHISTEAHKEPEEYLHWWMVGDYDVSTNWTHVGGDFTVTDELSETDKVGTVTFTLNNNQEESIEFYFDNISLKKIDENGNEEELVVNGQMEGNNWSSYVVKDADGTHDVTDNNLVINIYNQPDYPGWFCDHRTDITKAVFKSSFVDVRPVKTTNWFAVGNKNTEESALREIVGMQYLNTSEVVSMKNMFYGSRSLTNLDVSGFITSNVTDMYNMFDACSSLTNLDLSNFDTGNVTNMEWMFVDCSSLTNLDLSGFDTGNVTNMSGMFLGCSSLTSLDVSGFNTGNVTNMEWMFGWTSLTNLDVSGFDTRNVTSMAWMFIGCENLATIYCGEDWSTESVVFSEAMFDNCLSLVGGMGTTFDWAHTDAEYARADGGPSAPGYFTLEGAVPTNLNSTLADEDGEVARYGVDGTPLTGKRRGVNIVRMKDGTIRKVVVK